MNVPNLISLSRFFLIPFFIWAIMLDGIKGACLALVVLCISGLSDVLDGYLARKYNQVTDLGKVIDPLADKFIIISAALTLVYTGQLYAWVAAIVVIRELCMIVGSAISYRRGQKVISASYLGKGTTVLFYLAVIFFLFHWPFRYGILAVAILSSLIASIDYFQKTFAKNTARFSAGSR